MDLNDARSHVVGLLIRCPYDQNSIGCLLNDMRTKSLEDNIETAKRLTDEEVQHILDVHKKCLFQKETQKI